MRDSRVVVPGHALIPLARSRWSSGSRRAAVQAASGVVGVDEQLPLSCTALCMYSVHPENGTQRRTLRRRVALRISENCDEKAGPRRMSVEAPGPACVCKMSVIVSLLQHPGCVMAHGPATRPSSKPPTSDQGQAGGRGIQGAGGVPTARESAEEPSARTRREHLCRHAIILFPDGRTPAF